MEKGKAIPYSIDKLQDRGKFFVEPSTNLRRSSNWRKSRSDMCVNVTKEKQSNVRSGNDEKRIIPQSFSRRSFEYIQR
jgi:GTP-binding protein